MKSIVKILSILLIIGVVGGLGIGYVVLRIQAQNEGLRLEKGIVELNNSNTLQLNQYVASLKEQVGIANLKSQQFDKIIAHAVSSQFSQEQIDNKDAKGSLFSSLKEAYPNIDISVYDKIVEFVKAERAQYLLLQKQMQHQLADFDVWRASFPQSLFTTSLPDKWLTCFDDNGKQLFGQQAEDYLNTISQPNGSNNGGGQNAVTIPGLDSK